MDDAAKQSHPVDPLIRRALSHPRRTAALGYLMEKRGCETDEAELAATLDLPMASARYHLMVLRDADLIVQVGDRESGAANRYVAAAAAGV